MPQNLIPAESVIGLNAPVLAFTLCVAVLTPLIFGLVPALQSSRPDLNDALRDSGKGVTGGFRGRWVHDTSRGHGSGALLDTVDRRRAADAKLRGVARSPPGRSGGSCLQTRLALPGGRYKTAARRTEFFRPLLLRLKALPGIVDAAASNAIPPSASA